jgi:hypothetical protein
MIMARLYAVALLVLASGFIQSVVLAQTPAPAPATTSTTGPTVPPPAASPSTVGTAPGVNPANPADLSGRSNPQDMTSPNATNPQDVRPNK